MNNVILKTLIVLMLSGCASKYIAPETGSRAKVTYKSIAGNNDLQVFLFESYECKKPSMIKSFKSKGIDQDYAVYVKAGKPFINTFRSLQFGHNSSKFYYTTIELVPDENQEYIINLEGNDYMKVEVEKVGSVEIKPEELLQKPEKSCRW